MFILLFIITILWCGFCDQVDAAPSYSRPGDLNVLVAYEHPQVRSMLIEVHEHDGEGWSSHRGQAGIYWGDLERGFWRLNTRLSQIPKSNTTTGSNQFAYDFTLAIPITTNWERSLLAEVRYDLSEASDGRMTRDGALTISCEESEACFHSSADARNLLNRAAMRGALTLRSAQETVQATTILHVAKTNTSFIIEQMQLTDKSYSYRVQQSTKGILYPLSVKQVRINPSNHDLLLGFDHQAIWLPGKLVSSYDGSRWLEKPQKLKGRLLIPNRAGHDLVPTNPVHTDPMFFKLLGLPKDYRYSSMSSLCEILPLLRPLNSPALPQ